MSDATEKWRASLSAEGRLTAAQIDELESHVHDAMDRLASDELSDDEKFLVATQRLGHPAQLRREFEKVTPWATWRAPTFWATVGVVWVLGVEAILEAAVPLGALAATRLHLPLPWLKAWAFVACVGGPAIALASVAAWMRRYSAAHPASGKALFTTVAVAVLLRLGSLPILGALNATAWRGFDQHAARAFLAAWQSALLLGFVLVGGVAAVVLVRFPEPRTRAISG